MTVYLVDEDFNKFDAYMSELEYRGFATQALRDADLAFAHLRLAGDIDFVLIDVMLAAGFSDSRYKAAITDAGLVTGLVLLDDLCQARPEIFPARAHLITNATNTSVWRRANQKAQEKGIEVTDKLTFKNLLEFGDFFESRIRAIANG